MAPGLHAGCMQGPGVQVKFRVERPPQHTVLLGRELLLPLGRVPSGQHPVCGVTSLCRVPSKKASGLGELLVSCVSLG